MKKIILIPIILIILLILSLVYLLNYPIKEAPVSCGEVVIDFEGNLYNTIKIGNSCWMKENLKSKKGPTGNDIQRFCYDNKEENCDSDGGLYAWKVVEHKKENYGGFQGICPDNWHIPYTYELENLYANINNNISEFNIAFAGYKGDTEKYFEKDLTENYWSSIRKNQMPYYLKIKQKDNEKNGIYRNPMSYALSVRCIKNSN